MVKENRYLKTSWIYVVTDVKEYMHAVPQNTMKHIG